MEYEVVCNGIVIAQFMHLHDAQMFFDSAKEAYDDCHFELLTKED